MTTEPKAKPTPGPWTPNFRADVGPVISAPPYDVCHIEEWGAADNEESRANAALIAAAGTAAHECEAAGYDGTACVRALPVLLRGIRMALARVEIAGGDGNPILSAWAEDARAALAKCRGER